MTVRAATPEADAEAIVECACDGREYVDAVLASIEARRAVEHFVVVAKAAGTDVSGIVGELDQTLTTAGCELAPDASGYRLAERVSLPAPRKRKLYVAIGEGGRVCGVVEVTTNLEEDGAPVIEDVYVRQSCRRRGVGTELMRFVHDRFGRVVSRTPPSSEVARAFWTATQEEQRTASSRKRKSPDNDE